MEHKAWMVHPEAVLGDQPVKVQLDIAEGCNTLGACCPPRFGMVLEDWSLWHSGSPLYSTVLRIRARLVPRGATCLNFSLRNILGVPNQSHSGTVAIFVDTTGYASTIPPPCCFMESIAYLSAVRATPFFLYFLST